MAILYSISKPIYNTCIVTSNINPIMPSYTCSVKKIIYNYDDAIHELQSTNLSNYVRMLYTYEPSKLNYVFQSFVKDTYTKKWYVVEITSPVSVEGIQLVVSSKDIFQNYEKYEIDSHVFKSFFTKPKEDIYNKDSKHTRTIRKIAELSEELQEAKEHISHLTDELAQLKHSVNILTKELKDSMTQIMPMGGDEFTDYTLC